MSDENADLSELRIRQITAMRRSIHRSRSHALIAAGVCAVAAIECVVLAISHLRNFGIGIWSVVYIGGAMITGYGAAAFLKTAAKLRRQTNEPILPAADAHPDFSSLGDGSEMIRKLEEIE